MYISDFSYFLKINRIMQFWNLFMDQPLYMALWKQKLLGTTLHICNKNMNALQY